MAFAELKARSCYSFLRGASQPEELIRRSAELKLSALALCDRNGVYGMPKAFHESKSHPELKLITGTELLFEDGLLLTLLARDRKAYGLMCRMLTAAHADKEKGATNLKWAEFDEFLTRPEAKGLVALSDTNMAAKLPFLKDHFKERLYLMLTRHCDGKDRKRTADTQELSRRYRAPIVATNDVHYHVRARRMLQDVLTSIRENTPVSKAGYLLFSNAERYLKTEEQMRALFSDMPHAVDLTADIAESCTFSPAELKYRYPSEWIPAPHTAQSYLEELTWEGAKKRYPEGIPDKVTAQLQHELKLIGRMQFADYFLTIDDIVRFARSQNILCQGRGSAANSAVCFCLGITAIDPVRMDLLFERFISEERGEPPDIDVDFEHERREEVIQYIYSKYGRDRAAMVSAVNTYRGRSALRECAKALGVEVGTLSAREVEKRFDELSKGLPPKLKFTVESLAEQMEGTPRHLSIHSGGFTLSADPIIEIVPVEPARMEGRTIIQWDKYDLDYLGLLKIDVLALGMLTALHKTIDTVNESCGKTYELATVPAEDTKTYVMIQKADTVGTFQIESRAQMSMLGRLQPKNFYDLVIEVAIVRPGPIQGGMVHPYLKRRRGIEKVTFPHPALKQILGKTLGVPLFQEQVMKIAATIGGFTPGESDELRRAIGAWRSTGSIHKLGQKLIEGLTKNGLSPEFANQIYEQIKGFASYGFPESHAASFALLAYASCYFKCHYPAQFTCALVNSQPLGFYANHTLIDDAKRHGVEVRPLHPNLSKWDCTLEPTAGGKHAIRVGFRVVKGIVEDDVKKLEHERERQPFTSVSDFLARTALRRDVIYKLAMGDAFSCFGVPQRDALWEILSYERFFAKENTEQLNLFSEREEAALKETVHESFAPLTPFRAIAEDYNSYRLSTRGHPMEILRQHLPPRARAAIIEAKRSKPGARITASGLLIIKQRPPTANSMTFCTLEDETGFLDCVIHPPVYEKVKELMREHCFLVVSGVLQRDRESISLLIREMKPALTLAGAFNESALISSAGMGRGSLAY